MMTAKQTRVALRRPTVLQFKQLAILSHAKATTSARGLNLYSYGLEHRPLAGLVRSGLVERYANRAGYVVYWLAPGGAKFARGFPACRKCGCTEDRACDGGCWWREKHLCSACPR